MNCDQAFDCLTDPARRHSARLEEHLAHCERCRQMHDTLEPALDMFDELVPEPDLSHGGVAMRTLAPESVRVAEQAASRLSSSAGRSRGPRRGLILRYAAAAMAGALLMGVMGSINKVQSPTVDDLPPALSDVGATIPEITIPAPRETGDRAECLLVSGTIDRAEYPTPSAVVSRCAECHHDEDGTAFPANAQPISIEGPTDIEELADLIVRTMSLRRHSLMLAQAQIHPRRVDRLA